MLIDLILAAAIIYLVIKVRDLRAAIERRGEEVELPAVIDSTTEPSAADAAAHAVDKHVTEYHTRR